MRNHDIETLPVRKQHEICDGIKLKRLETLLPKIMKESGIDMWLILAGEYNEDPVFFSLVPSIVENASRMTCLAVVKEKDGSYGRYSINKPNRYLGRFYKQLEFDNSLQWQQIADFIREKDPKTIGINTSPLSPLASGLTAALYGHLVKVLGPLSERLVCADDLAVRWIETRTDEEMAMYPSVYEVTTQIMNRAFSREVIVPGVTTTEDVEWWCVEEFYKRGLPQGFRTAVNFQRRGEEGGMLTGVIRHGDLLHYDAGIRYLGLATDHQRLAYVLKPGETEAPKGIREGFMLGHRFSDMTGREMLFGRTGNEVFHAAKAAAAKEGIDASLYTHPIGLYVHSAGPTIGLYDKQESIPGRGENIVRPDTAYALEYNVASEVPEWGGQKVRFYLEETVLLRESGKISYLDADYEKLILI